MPLELIMCKIIYYSFSVLKTMIKMIRIIRKNGEHKIISKRAKRLLLLCVLTTKIVVIMQNITAKNFGNDLTAYFVVI